MSDLGIGSRTTKILDVFYWRYRRKKIGTSESAYATPEWFR